MQYLLMNKDEIIGRIKQLGEIEFNREFPHEDCKTIAELATEYDWIKADLNTFFHSLWSLCWLAHSDKKLMNLSNEDLEKYEDWLDKSFFERFPEYTSAEQFITPMLTPKLYEALNVNEELRKLLSMLLSAELMKRKSFK